MCQPVVFWLRDFRYPTLLLFPIELLAHLNLQDVQPSYLDGNEPAFTMPESIWFVNPGDWKAV